MEDKQVIVVDRSPMWRGREMAILDGAGYRTDAFPTYADARERLLQDQTLRGAVLGYDIGSASEENGLAVLSRIRSTSSLPVIICAEPFQGCSFVSAFGKAFYIDRTIPAEYFNEVLRNSASGLFGVPAPQVEVKSVKERPTILVAEDEQAQRIIEMRILTRMGYDVVEARNGDEARTALYGRDDIDGFSTDNELGRGPSGLALLADLRASDNPRLTGMPVLVACSDPDSKGNRIDIEALREYGAEFIAKPFVVEEYSAAIDRAFSHLKQPKS
ncbi:MAG: response regulator [Candidatus Aenigmarchaeota archaeon]|nr:response regulator [Candidatus Aenigmarchaeota archaeon]